MDHTLDEVERRLEEPVSAEAQAAYAEAMVTILEQVATLRTIGSQTHPALQQMILNHDQELQAVQQKLDEIVQSVASSAAADALTEAADIKKRLDGLEAQYRQLGSSSCECRSDVMA